MNMAAAVSATSGANAHFAISALRAGSASSASPDQAADRAVRADTGASGSDGKETAYPRFVSPVLDYNQGAERMVMLFRNPTTGKTEDQIPTEAALKQYQEAAQRTRTQRNNEALVAGTDGEAVKTGPSGTGTGTGIGTEAKGDGSPAKVGGGFAAANVAAEISTGNAPTGNTSTGNRASPASGSRGTAVPATSSGGSGGNGSGGVRFNFVV